MAAQVAAAGPTLLEKMNEMTRNAKLSSEKTKDTGKKEATVSIAPPTITIPEKKTITAVPVASSKDEMLKCREWTLTANFDIDYHSLDEDGKMKTENMTGTPGGTTTLPIYAYPAGQSIPAQRSRGMVPVTFRLLPGDKDVDLSFDMSYLFPHVCPKSTISGVSTYSLVPRLLLPGTVYSEKPLPMVEVDTAFLALSNNYPNLKDKKEVVVTDYDHPLLSQLHSGKEVHPAVLESAILMDTSTDTPCEDVQLVFKDTKIFDHIECVARVPETPEIQDSGCKATAFFKIGPLRDEVEWDHCFSLSVEPTSVYLDRLTMRLPATQFKDWIHYLRTLPKCYESSKATTIIEQLKSENRCVPTSDEDSDVDSSIPLNPNQIAAWARQYLLDVYQITYADDVEKHTPEEGKEKRRQLYTAIKAAVIKNLERFTACQHTKYAESLVMFDVSGEGEGDGEFEEYDDDDVKVTTATAAASKYDTKKAESKVKAAVPVPTAHYTRPAPTSLRALPTSRASSTGSSTTNIIKPSTGKS